MAFLERDDIPYPPFAPPFLKDGDVLIGQTAAILLYLGDLPIDLARIEYGLCPTQARFVSVRHDLLQGRIGNKQILRPAQEDQSFRPMAARRGFAFDPLRRGPAAPLQRSHLVADGA